MIKRISLKAEFTSPAGLHAAEFDRLGKVVVLAGPNGSGKTRYMRLVASVLHKALYAEKENEEAQEQVKLLESLMLPWPPGYIPTRDDEMERTAQSAQHQKHQQRVRSLAEMASKVVSTRPLQKHKGEWTANVIRLSYSDTLSIQNPNKIVSARHLEIDSEIDEPSYQAAYEGMYVYAAKVARLLWNARHPDVPTVSADEAHQFNRILDALLGSGIEPMLDSAGFVQPGMRGRYFNPIELSAGERILMTWAIALHRQGNVYRDAIVMLDEPENHLHPSICINVVERLANALSEHGQIWIATHSIPLVAHLGLDSLYLVKDASVTLARRRVNDVMASLAGGSDGVDRIRLFLRDTHDVTTAQFLAQCLTSPESLELRAGDPQGGAFRKLMAARTSSTPIKVLDFGAGKGRLASTLPPRTEAISYYAYNAAIYTSEDDRDRCIANLSTLSDEEPSSHYFDSMATLRATHKGTFDVVVLCNVLHEIPPRDWMAVFDDVAALLQPKGSLLVMEDLVPSVGELPHTGGYVVLDSIALRALFGGSQDIRIVDSQMDGRLMIVEVPAQAVARATAETRYSTLTYVRAKAREQIQAMRALSPGERTSDTGRRHAHFTVQFANADLALQELDSVGPKPP